MSELSHIGKIIQALNLAKIASVDCTLTNFDAIELLGYMKLMEEDAGLAHAENEKLSDQIRAELKEAGNKLADRIESSVNPLTWEEYHISVDFTPANVDIARWVQLMKKIEELEK